MRALSCVKVVAAQIIAVRNLITQAKMTLLTLEYKPSTRKRDFFMQIQRRTSNRRILRQMLFILLGTSLSGLALASSKNGFLLDAPLVHEREILQGGPPRDGIPSIDEPQFVDSDQAHFLHPSDRVLGVVFNGDTKAYPIKILNFHEIVNDSFGRHPVLVSYCPLCGTGMAFDALMNGQSYLFGVSGLLYNSDLLMYDRNSQSLWSQIEALAINGPMKGSRLQRIPLEHTTWQDWRSRYPATKVLSTQTGYWRDYGTSPYPGYSTSEHVYFPVANADKRYHPKELVLGVEIDGQVKAYPFTELDKLDQGQNHASSTQTLTDSINGKNYSIRYDAEHRTAQLKNSAEEVIPTVIVYWFAWIAFHPKTDVFVANP